MCDLVTDIILRIGKADDAALRNIYRREIVRPIFTEDERQLLTNAFDKRACELNAAAMGLQRARW